MPNGFEIIELGKTVADSEDDPDNTMFLSVTKKELGLLLFGTHFVRSLFPEVRTELDAMCAKIKEVGHAQEFLS